MPDSADPPSLCTPASLSQILSEDVPIRDVLAFPPQQITSPLAIEAAYWDRLRPSLLRDFGQSDPAAKFITAGDGPLVQIPGTGVTWKICPAK